MLLETYFNNDAVVIFPSSPWEQHEEAWRHYHAPSARFSTRDMHWVVIRSIFTKSKLAEYARIIHPIVLLYTRIIILYVLYTWAQVVVNDRGQNGCSKLLHGYMVVGTTYLSMDTEYSIATR